MFISEDYPKRIDVQIGEYTPSPPDFSLSVGSTTVLSSNDWISYVYNTYGNYQTCAALYTLWKMYDDLHHADFAKGYQAAIAEYVPIDNYAGSETRVVQKMDGEKTETITHGKTTTITANNVKSTNNTSTFDNATPRYDNDNTQSGNSTEADTGTTTTTTDTDVKSLTIGNKTYSADYVEAETLEKHGNLGVTSSQKMVTEEYELRLKSFITMYIDMFITEYAFLVSGGYSREYCVL